MYGMCTHVFECLYVLYVCYLYMYVCILGLLCSCMWRPAVDMCCLCQFLSTLLFCDKVSAAFGVKQLSQAGWRALLRLHNPHLVPGPHACAGSSLREPSLQAVFFCSLYNVNRRKLGTKPYPQIFIMLDIN